VRFASECLAFANVGDHDDPRAGVPRDVRADWDFADVRDHYLRELHGLDPDVAGWDRARLVTGEVMAHAFGEWRRAGSPCAGALVLWLRDVVPGSGWGVLDHAGRPKAAFHHLRRALAPVAAWTVDEGLNGLVVHVANDLPRPLAARLRVAFYHGGEVLVDQVAADVDVPAHGHWERDVEGLLGRFVDASYAYRFGPLTHEVCVVTLRSTAGDALLSADVRFVGTPPADAEAPERLGLTGTLAGHELTVRTDRLAYGVRVVAAGFEPSDDAFVLEPGGERRVQLRPAPGADPAPPARVVLRAANLEGEVAVA
jgi:beta-mannosidase